MQQQAVSNGTFAFVNVLPLHGIQSVGADFQLILTRRRVGWCQEAMDLYENIARFHTHPVRRQTVVLAAHLSLRVQQVDKER